MRTCLAVLIVAWGSAAWSSEVRGLIAALPGDSPSEQVKKAALEVSLERIEELRAGGVMMDEKWDQEIRTRLSEPAESVAIRKDGPNLSVLRIPLVTEGNPHLERLVAGAREEASKPDVVWPRVGGDRSYFDSATAQGPYNPRHTAAAMEALLWLYANPASPLRGDPEVLRRLLRRALAYAQAIVAAGEEGRKESIYDDFAMAPASIVLRELPTLHPSLLLPSERRLLEDAMRTAGRVVMKHSIAHAGRHARGYANIDAALALQLLNFGLFLQDDAMLEQYRALLARIDRAVLPDGGTHYIWSQNESYGYHGVIAQFLAQMHEISGQPEPLETLRRLEWYGPVSVGRIGEYWTAPSWKQTWNSQMNAFPAGDYVAGVTGNPYVRRMAGEADPTRLAGWESSRPPLPWYRNDILPADSPDELLFNDRNIEGPRGRFGRFQFAATLREIPEDEPGHATLVGAMTLTPEFGLQAILMGVGPRVLVGEDRQEARSWASIMSGLKSSHTSARGAFAFAAMHRLAAFRASSKGPEAPVTAFQLWFGDRNRLVGWIGLRAEDPTAALLLEGVVRLGTGGTVSGPMQMLRRFGAEGWKYGDLVIQPLGHNFAELTDELVPFRRANAPITELQWRGSQGEGLRWFAVEIRPAWSAPADVEIRDPVSLQPRIVVREEDRTFEILANFSPAVLPVEALSGGKRASRWMEGQQATGALLLPSGKVLLTIESGRAADHEPPWHSLQQALAVPDAHP